MLHHSQSSVLLFLFIYHQVGTKEEPLILILIESYGRQLWPHVSLWNSDFSQIFLTAFFWEWGRGDSDSSSVKEKQYFQ